MDGTKPQLTLMCWNCRGIFSCIPYLSECLRETNVSICALSEHWLRTFQLHVLDTIDDNYVSIGKGSDEGNPTAITCNYRSGVAFLISKDIYPFVSVIEVDSKRITGIELSIPGCESYFIFSVYLPAITQSSDSFRDHIDLLSELVSVYNEIGTVILMGDFNSKIGGPRYQVTSNVRAKMCSSLMGEHNLFSVNMELFCKGPIVTFQSYDGGPSTCIDHILMNNAKKHTVIRAEVLDNHSFALSDHHPVLCTLILESVIPTWPVNNYEQSVSWDKARRTHKTLDYSYAVSQNLWTLEFPQVNDTDEIEIYYSKIVDAIKKAENDTLPYKKFKRHVKPYWNDNLTSLRDSMRTHRINWINNCHCYNQTCPYFQRYKSTKKVFREFLRKALDEYESSLAKQIEEDIDYDQKSVWSIINKRKKKPIFNTLKKGDSVFTDPNDVSNIWYDHFRNVFSPSTYSEQGRQDEISERVSTIRTLVKERSCDDEMVIKLSDVSEICTHLKNNKACGHDNISYEHIKYGGKLLIKHLCYLFNLSLQFAYIPNDWKKSIIILLYKGDHKPRTDTNSYRGISLVPSITKIFEKILDLLLTSIRKDFPNVQQVAYQKLLSSMNASFNLQEVTIHHVEKNGTIIIILLDSTKAFDTVPHDGLRIKLFDYGAAGNLWLLLDNMYNNLSSSVLCNGILSKWFKLNRGVRQGSALSAKLYLIFINDLINELVLCNKGAYLYDLNASSPVQADDISIIATNRESAQEMVAICERYSKAWSFSFSPGKSKLLQFGKHSIGQNVILYNEPITQVSSAKHVGIVLDTSLKTMERTLNACRSLRGTVMSMLRTGVHPAVLNPLVCAKIIRQVCYPKALYGCELWGELSKTEMLMLERTHRYICKTIQGLPKLTRSDMCLSLIGWYTINAFISERKLLFFGRICNLPQTAISFRILIRRLFVIKHSANNHKTLGFTNDCVKLFQKYNLVEFVDVFLTNGTFPSMRTWKHLVYDTIRKYELSEWIQRLNDDDEFDRFRSIHQVYQPHQAWTVALSHPHLRKQAHYIVSLCCLIRNATDNFLCDKCGKFFNDPCTHATTSCDYLSDIHDKFWTEIISLDPITFSAFLGCKSDDELCFILLSCDTDFELDNDNMARFQLLCVTYVYRCCDGFNCQ